MSHARYMVGDVFDVLATLEDASVDLVLTSPPFLALRSYLPADHPDKAKEIGSEPTPAAFLDTLLALTAEWRRVLAPHGSICVELGDTYSGSGGAGGDYNALGMRADQPLFRQSRSGRREDAWPMDKSLCGIPHLYHLSLAYGRNLLTGEPSPAGQWRVRNVVAWCRPNPPVGALGDKFRPATSYMTVATVARDRYFDLDAVRTEHSRPHFGNTTSDKSKRLTGSRADDGKQYYTDSHPAGAPPLDWWDIPTQPYAGSHYATWPMALCTRPIRAMCPQRVCLTCGEPSRRIVGEATYVGQDGNAVTPHVWQSGIADAGAHSRKEDGGVTRQAPTLGWTDCGHGNYRVGRVLDPFAGSGTTLAVATGEGRDAIGIDLDHRNADLARERVGMFLEVDEDPPGRPVVDVELPA